MQYLRSEVQPPASCRQIQKLITQVRAGASEHAYMVEFPNYLKPGQEYTIWERKLLAAWARRDGRRSQKPVLEQVTILLCADALFRRRNRRHHQHPSLPPLHTSCIGSLPRLHLPFQIGSASSITATSRRIIANTVIHTLLHPTARAGLPDSPADRRVRISGGREHPLRRLSQRPRADYSAGDAAAVWYHSVPPIVPMGPRWAIPGYVLARSRIRPGVLGSRLRKQCTYVVSRFARITDMLSHGSRAPCKIVGSRSLILLSVRCARLQTQCKYVVSRFARNTGMLSHDSRVAHVWSLAFTHSTNCGLLTSTPAMQVGFPRVPRNTSMLPRGLRGAGMLSHVRAFGQACSADKCARSASVLFPFHAKHRYVVSRLA